MYCSYTYIRTLFFRKYTLTYLGVKSHDVYKLLSYGSEKKNVCLFVHGRGRVGTNDKANVVKCW